MDFGISLDPLSVTQRHAVYDSDEEEQEEAEGTAEIFFIRGTSSSSESFTLLIALGQVSVTFVRSFLILEDQPTFLLSSRTSKVVKGLHFPARSHEGEGGQELPDPVSSVYVARGKQPGSGEEGLFLVCTHEKVLKSEYCNLWAAKLLKHLRPSSTLILDSTPLHEHFSPYPDNPDHGSFSRSLQSSNWPHPPTAAFLEPPNTVKGEAAAALTHCQVNQLPASALVLYLPPSQSGLENVTSFKHILHHPLIANHLAVKPEGVAIEDVKRLLPRPRADLSNLYT